MTLRVTVWNEGVHEREREDVRAVYPEGIHAAVADALVEHHGDAVAVRTATLADPEHGLPPEVLDATDVLTWWGHGHHDDVRDDVVDRVVARVHAGMGLVVLHSGHYSKPFRRLMGSGCGLRWREADDRELIFTVAPTHPITEGVPEVVEIPRHEMYGEFFDIPAPDELVFISSFSGGEVFRSGCCFRRGNGRIFYFSPGHETYPVYRQPAIRRVLANAVVWAATPLARSRPTIGAAPNAPTGWWREVADPG